MVVNFLNLLHDTTDHGTWEKVEAGSQKLSFLTDQQICFARLHAIQKHLLVSRSPLFKKNEKLIDPAAIGGIWVLLKETTQKNRFSFQIHQRA